MFSVFIGDNAGGVGKIGQQSLAITIQNWVLNLDRI